jgi:hypothetical protein
MDRKPFISFCFGRFPFGLEPFPALFFVFAHNQKANLPSFAETVQTKSMSIQQS